MDIVVSYLDRRFISSIIRIIQAEEAPYFLCAAFYATELSPKAFESCVKSFSLLRC
jgi:hypothetical protein